MIAHIILILLFVLASCAHGPNESTLRDENAKKDYIESIEIKMPYGEFKERYNKDNKLIKSAAIFDVRLKFAKNGQVSKEVETKVQKNITSRVQSYLESKGLKSAVVSKAEIKDDLDELILDDEYLDKLSKKYEVESFVVLSSEINFDKKEKAKLLITTDTKNYFFVPHFLFVESGGRAGWVDVNDVAIGQGEGFEFLINKDDLIKSLEDEIFLQFKLVLDKLFNKQGIIE